MGCSHLRGQYPAPCRFDPRAHQRRFHAIQLADKGWRRAAKENPELASGLNIIGGKVVCKTRRRRLGAALRTAGTLTLRLRGGLPGTGTLRKAAAMPQTGRLSSENSAPFFLKFLKNLYICKSKRMGYDGRSCFEPCEKQAGISCDS